MLFRRQPTCRAIPALAAQIARSGASMRERSGAPGGSGLFNASSVRGHGARIGQRLQRDRKSLGVDDKIHGKRRHIDIPSPAAHGLAMLQRLRSTLRSSCIAGLLACAIAMLVAMPVLRASARVAPWAAEANVAAAAALPCHKPAAEHTAIDRVAMVHDAQSTGRDGGHGEAPADDGSRRAEWPLSNCCVPGCAVLLIPAGMPLDMQPRKASRHALPVLAEPDGLEPGAPRKPPRTTVIADLAA